MKRKLITLAVLILSSFHQLTVNAETYLTFKANPELVKNKHIVLLSGDEEYRSEESMPMMAQILAKQGFDCTVLFSMDEANKYVSPKATVSLSNPDALDSADLFIVALRFRKWDDTTMTKFEEAFKRGVPMIALRTATHVFNFKDKNSKWRKYSWNNQEIAGWKGGFGRVVFGETWVAHHGAHKKEGTRTKTEEINAKHPVLNSVGEIFALSDVYTANPVSDSTILLRGLVTESLDPDSKVLEGKKNNPAQPVAWVREYKHADGTVNNILTTTMGAAIELVDEDLRRLIVNAVYWGLNLEVPKAADVTIDGNYKPTMYGFNTYQKNMKPSDFIPTK